MHAREVYVADVVGAVIILDLSAYLTSDHGTSERQWVILPVQSTHCILTVSLFLIVPHAGTARNQILAELDKCPISPVSLTVRVPSVLGAVSHFRDLRRDIDLHARRAARLQPRMYRP